MVGVRCQTDRMDEHAITSAKALGEIYGEPLERTRRKQISHLDEHCRRLIALSPFALLATAGADGRCDVTPRGGPAGFCRVLEDGRLAIPDVKGNRRLDSLRNIVENPHAGLLFMVPGMRETLRVNGAAELTTRPDVVALASDPGKPAILAVLVRPDEVFLHCAKALIRSALWEAGTWPDADELPSAAEILRDHVGDGRTAAQVQADLEESIATRLY